MSTYELARRVGIHSSTMADIQTGAIKKPGPEILSRIAESLDVSESELYALAGYLPGEDLPDLRGYLNIKYRSLPPAAVDSLIGHAEYLAAKHATDNSKTTQPRKEGS
jgi:transcriptional regulator with XRE-family HTH domain